MANPDRSDGITTGVIVGIDIGMTGTGVAVCAYDNTHHQRPTVIQEWPGTTAAVVNKVPTRVAYRAGFSRLHSWGFACPEFGERKIEKSMAIFDLFKFQLQDLMEGREANQGGVKVEIEDVKNWYRDFLSALYDHIGEYLIRELNVDFERGTVPVDYIFSIPTTWIKNHELVDTFRQVVDEAGFSSGNVTMELTEGEAAAIFTAAMSLDHQLQKGEAFIVCDAGGETTDLCSLQVTKVDGNAIQLELLASPQAIRVGSVRIDELFEKRAKEYLGKLNMDDKLRNRLAHGMRKGAFQQLKTKFGTRLDLRKMSIDVQEKSCDSMEFSSMEFSWDELKDMFDEQIKAIIIFINDEIRFLERLRPEIKLSYIFLAGGLGSSKYLQDELKNHYKGIQVLYTDNPDPPLAVCKGLVFDRLQCFTNQASVIPIKGSSASYGILCRELYGKKHLGQQAVRNQLDGNKYAENQIDWFIVKGQKAKEGDTLKRRYSRVVEPGSETKRWGFAVVWSRVEPQDLPSFVDFHRRAAVICYVAWEPEAGANPVGALKKWRLFGKKYWHVDYEVTAVIELGKLKFKSKIIGRVIRDEEEEDLKVRWPVESEVVEGDERCSLIKAYDP